MNLIVTTAQKPSPDVIRLANDIAARLCVQFIPRNSHSLATIREKYEVCDLIVVASNGPIIHTAAGEYFFHLSMAELRIKNLINGKHDHMVIAMGLEAGMSVLDCTLGLATDAIVASFVAGETGIVTGLESSQVIALITGYGLQNFTVDSEADITSALRRVKVENAEYCQYLEELPDNSFDIVYFDPMFRNPIYKSSNVNPIRTLANMSPLTPEAIRQACRVAKQKVVVKEAVGSSEFARLGLFTVVGGKYSSIKYGVIDCRPKMAGGGQPWNA
ncbi:class I SAM-dependent methyltransferase [Sporomusa sp.]|uniref:class I SAM-dependent methyltransferase n=1 Tax=Sporomusa sp. TaxID=2078658 RepID=UPI002B78A068|nr:class I SAM-dependent methyltransferase [Sporomusa sp.]HWR43071.1 class I SAM-dependent methyltransferase [Sporomusa sp.]